MIDLATRTKPGPFFPRTIELGAYVGIRRDRRLAAMAGERMRFGRFVEISAVCVDQEFRGRGYAALLTRLLARRQQEQGLMPFLHVVADNRPAIALYEKLGFTHRAGFFITVVRRG